MSTSTQCVAACSVLLLALAPAVAIAQESRAELIAAAQAAKAQRLAPYVPNAADRFASGMRERIIESPGGFYPWFESVYSGGGFTLGAGYRQYYGDRTRWYAQGLLSGKGYKLVELATDSLGVAAGRVDIRAVGGWRDATQVAFYGLGSSTAPSDISNFEMKQAYAGVAARARGPGATVFDAGLRYEDFTIEPGNGISPSIEESHTADTAPGLGANPAYWRLTLTGGVDSRPAAGYARRGGKYALTLDRFAERDDLYSFDILQAEVVQHVPILRENWVFSVHGVAKTTLDDESTVPFFLLPALGSGSTLRGYPSWRFRDRHSILVSGEWRWIPNHSFLDFAIFYDAGKVVSRREELNFANLTHNWGIGARFHSAISTPLRIEVARGREGFNLVFSGAAAF